MHVERRFAVSLGRHRNLDEVMAAFVEHGCWVNPRTEFLLEEVAADEFRTTADLNLAVLRVENLGFPKGGFFGEICVAAQSRGFDFCPPEVGHLLRLAYLKQSGTKLLYIAMEPIFTWSGNPFIYALIPGFGGPLLYSECMRSLTHLHSWDKLVFVEN